MKHKNFAFVEKKRKNTKPVFPVMMLRHLTVRNINMSILSNDDPANNIDIFKYHPDFDHTKIKIWNRDIPGYSDIKPQTAIFDIETTPIKRAINGDIDFHHHGNMILAIRIRINGKDYVLDKKFYQEGEFAVLTSFIDILDKEDIYILTGHNIFNFDLPYIMARCELYFIPHGFKFQESWNDKFTEVKNSMMFGRPIKFYNIVHSKFNIIDTMHLCAIADKREAKLNSFGLKYVCGKEGYGLRGDRVELPGDKIATIHETDNKLFHEYLKDDIDDTELLIDYHLPSTYYLLRYIPNINLQNLIFSGNGQKWNLILKNHYQGYYPETDPITDKIQGAITGIQSGCFKNCGKFDVASLYPSIMLAMRICSRKDPDQYQLKVLSFLKAERLRLKKLKTKEGKFESDALKIIINSGYGFLGTEFIKFNDPIAAGKVTMYGRAILNYMISFVKSLGARVLQADTDGIVLNHDTISLIEIHRQLQEALPGWVEVEFEAEYDLVWIYKRKNYITFKGEKCTPIGIARKRDKPQLMKNYFKYIPQLYIKKGMDSVQRFTNNIIEKIKNRQMPIELLAQKEKIKEYTNGTKSQIEQDLQAKPGESVTYYIIKVEEKYTTPKNKIEKTRFREGYKRVENYNNDYYIEYYVNQFLANKWSDKKQEFTEQGYFYMFKNSIEYAINECSSGAKL